MTKYATADSIGFLLNRTHKALRTFFNLKMKQQGISVNVDQWIAMKRIWENEGQSQQSLASQMCQDKTFVTRLVDELEKEGLVVRQASLVDRRNKMLVPTQKSEELRQKIQEVISTIIRPQVENDFTPDEIEQLKYLLDKLYFSVNKQLNNEGIDDSMPSCTAS